MCSPSMSKRSTGWLQPGASSLSLFTVSAAIQRGSSLAIRNDPSSRVVSRIPGYDTIVSQVSETTLRVLIEMLGDPRMDELVSDLLRNNLQQIKRAVREREHLDVEPHPPPDLSPMRGPRPPRGGPGR